MILAAILAAAQLNSSDIRLTSKPDRVLIEEGVSGRSLNFDILIENPTDAPLDLDEVRLSVFDGAGKLVLRKFVDGNGTRPSIRTADLPDIPAHSTVMLFNPFSSFARDIDLTRLAYDLKFSGKQGSPVYASHIEVKPASYLTKTKLILPVKGRLVVYDGHDALAHHRRWDYTIPGLHQLGFHSNFMRYSYDLVPVDQKGNMSKGDEQKNESFFGFAQDVLAAGDGKIVSVADEKADDRNFNPSMLSGNNMQLWGNYVVIDHGNGEYSLYGHLHQGSAKVKPGQAVKQGQKIAEIGAAGSSKFPHLHFELQDGPDTNAEGLPSSFRNFRKLAGAQSRLVSRGSIDSGEFIESK